MHFYTVYRNARSTTDTKAAIELLKELGGKHYCNTATGGGWIFNLPRKLNHTECEVIGAQEHR